MKAVGWQEGAAVEDRPPGGLGASRPGGGPNPWIVPCLYITYMNSFLTKRKKKYD